MERQVVWTVESLDNIESIIAYLQRRWTQNEIYYFLDELERLISLIQSSPTLFRKSFKTGIHEVLVTKHNLLVYKYDDSILTILQVWDTRQDPESKVQGDN